MKLREAIELALEQKLGILLAFTTYSYKSLTEHNLLFSASEVLNENWELVEPTAKVKMSDFNKICKSLNLDPNHGQAAEIKSQIFKQRMPIKDNK